jgi:hypothetical protein
MSVFVLVVIMVMTVVMIVPHRTPSARLLDDIDSCPRVRVGRLSAGILVAAGANSEEGKRRRAHIGPDTLAPVCVS